MPEKLSIAKSGYARRVLASFSLGNLTMLREYQFGKSSDEVQGIRRICVELFKQRVMLADIYLLQSTLFSLWMSCYSYPEIVVKNPFQTRDNHRQNFVCRSYIQG